MSKRTNELNARIEYLTGLQKTEQDGPDPSTLYINDLSLSIQQCQEELTSALATDAASFTMVK